MTLDLEAQTNLLKVLADSFAIDIKRPDPLDTSVFGGTTKTWLTGPPYVLVTARKGSQRFFYDSRNFLNGIDEMFAELTQHLLQP